MHSVSCRHCRWTSRTLTDVLSRCPLWDLVGVPTQYGTPWAVVWPDSVAHIRFCSGRLARAEDGLEQGGAKGTEAA